MPNPRLFFGDPNLKDRQPLVVFTAYMLQDYASCDEKPANIENGHKESWYPTIYFFGLEE